MKSFDGMPLGMHVGADGAIQRCIHASSQSHIEILSKHSTNNRWIIAGSGISGRVVTCFRYFKHVHVVDATIEQNTDPYITIGSSKGLASFPSTRGFVCCILAHD